jgi:hypothetical protein
VNNDGAANIGDALIIAQFVAGRRVCGQAPFGHAERCDVNHDGLCNIADATALSQCDVGAISCSFACTPFVCP